MRAYQRKNVHNTKMHMCTCRQQPDLTSQPPIYALDCEMCVTDTSDRAVVSATLVDEDGQVIFDELIKPEGRVLDYKSSVHGLSAEVLKVRSYATLRGVQCICAA